MKSEGRTLSARLTRRTGFRWRRVVAGAGILVALASVVGGGLAFVLPRVATREIRAQLAAHGVVDAHFAVDRIGWKGLQLSNVRVGPSFSVARVEVEWEPSTVLAGGAPTSITLRGLRWRVRPDAASLRASVPGRLFAAMGSSSTGRSTSGPRRVQLTEATLVIEGRSQSLSVRVDGELQQVRDGDLRAAIEVGEDASESIASGAAPSNLRVTARRSAGGALHVGVAGRLRAFDHTVFGPRLSAAGAHVDGRAVVADGKIATLDLRGVASGVSVDGDLLGDIDLRGDVRGPELILSVAAGDERLAGRLRATLPSDVRSWPAQSRWSWDWWIEGDVDPARVERRALGVRLDSASLVAAGSGSVELRRAGGPRWAVRLDQLDAAASRIEAPGVRLDGVALRASGRAVVEEDRLSLWLEEDSRFQVHRASTRGVGVRRMELTGAARVDADGSGMELRDGEGLSVRMGTLALGAGAPIRLGPITGRARRTDERPLLVHRDGRTRFVARVDARAARIRGELRGRGGRVWGQVEGELDRESPKLSGELFARVDELHQPDAEVSARDVRARLPLSGSGGSGTVESPHLFWRGLALGRTTGTIAVLGEHLDLILRCRATDDAHAELSLALRPPGGSVDLVVPESVVRAGDPFERALAHLSKLRVTGRVGATLHVDFGPHHQGTETPARATLSLTDATVARLDGETRAHGVDGRLSFSALAPLTTRDAAPVRWTELTLGEVLTTGPGVARLGFAGVERVSIHGLDVEWGGARIRALPFHFDPANPDLNLALTVRGLSVAEVLRAATGGRATGSGTLDGWVAFRMRLGDDPLLVLGESQIASRGGGRIRVGDEDLVESMAKALRSFSLSDWVKQRIAATLSDFDYRRLLFTVRRGAGTTGVSMRVRGRGHTLPQELDLVMNVDAIQSVINQVLRAWPTVEVDALRFHLEAK